ncbi:ankyrin repeat-containing domain protein [Xylaria flabelliformis]|nr:ankyrin repeat-containing domain protein [Xylaria flabelliformis]
MASLGKLPVETALQVLQDLGIRDLAAFAATCRGYYVLANPLLYKLEAQDIRSYAFFDAAGSGNVGLMQKLVDAGFDVNRQWRSAFPGPRFEKIRILSRWYEGRCSRTKVVRHYRAESKRHAKAIQARYQSTYIQAKTDSDYEEDVPPSKSEIPDLIVENYDFSSSCSLGSSGKLGAMNEIHWTALHLAVANGQNNAVSFLIDKGADINAPSTGYCQCSQIRAYISNNSNDGAPPPVWSPLHMAICRGHFQTAKQLLIRGASTVVEVDKLGSPQNQSRCTALHLACYHGPYRLVTTLIKDGYQSDLEVQDGLQQTPFVYAFWAQQFDRIIPYLKRKGSTGTCLIIACRASQYEDAIRLVELGVDVNSVELQTDNSPLHICAKLLTSMFRATRVGYHQLGAAAKRRHQLARELLKAGASLTSLNRDGRTPLDLATTHLDGQMTKFFMEYKDITDSEIGEIGEPSRLS